ncbi:unnamed protein product, partial [Brenthis ino]
MKKTKSVNVCTLWTFFDLVKNDDGFTEGVMSYQHSSIWRIPLTMLNLCYKNFPLPGHTASTVIMPCNGTHSRVESDLYRATS